MKISELLPFIPAALVLFGTLGGTYLGQRLSLSKDRKLKQDEIERHARYLAVQVICRLDPFVNECCDVARDMGEPGPDDEMNPSVADPMVAFPNDVDWKSIPPDLMYRILSIPNDIAIANRHIQEATEYVASAPDYKEYFHERIVQFARIGLEATAIADELRTVCRVPKREWDPKKLLETAIADVEATIRQEQERKATRQALRAKQHAENQTPPHGQAI